jgi:SAM-dependent methyltransferase
MSQRDMTAPACSGYGDYILRTGKGVVADLELACGAYWYQKFFAGKKPILDLGPGRCWFTRQNPAEIIAVDNSPELVEHYRQAQVDIRCGEAYAIPFPDGYFEGVFCCWLLEHLSDPARAFSEMQRVLKPGGYLCVIVPSPHDMFSFYDDYTHVRPFTPASLFHLAEGAAFSRRRVECLPWLRGLKIVVRRLPAAAHSYIRFCDVVLRRFGLLNRNNLMLEAWK